MIVKFLDFLYLNNFFRFALYFLKILSFFDTKYEKKINFFKFFKKRKKKYKKNILKILYQPKVFIFNLDYDTEKVIKAIYNYNYLNVENQYSDDGHSNVFQSEHNLEKNINFIEISKNLEFHINNKLKDFLNYQSLNIAKLWFVITKNLGVIKKHSHFESDFSGVLYLKVEENNNSENGLRIYNFLENIEIYEFSKVKQKFIKSINNDQTILLKPKNNDLIIFNSYIEHGVDNKTSNNVDRISLPFDLVFNTK